MALGERWRGPSPWLIAAVALTHAALLGPTPRRAPPQPAAPLAPALLTRALSAPAPSITPPATSAQPAHALVPAKPSPAKLSPAVAAERAALPAARTAPAAPAAPKPTTTAAPTAASAVATTAPRPSVSADAAQPTPPEPVRVAGAATLSYQVTGRARGVDYVALAELQWRRQGERYEAVWTVESPSQGTRWQRSEGTITATGLTPERYAEKSRGERAAHFDAEGARIRFSANTPDARLAPGAQDRLSVALQLGALLAAAPERYPAGTQIVVQTAGAREAEAWTWEVLPDETMRLGERELNVVKLSREPRRDYDSRVELWLARAVDHLPVRLRTTQANGDVVDQQLHTVGRFGPTP